MMKKSNLRRFIKFVIKINKKTILISLILLIISIVANIYVPLLTKNMIDRGIIDRNTEILFIYLVIFVVISLIDIVSDVILGYLYSLMRSKVVVMLRMKLLKHISILSGEFFTDKKTGNLLSIVQSDIDIVESIDTELFLNMMKNIVIAGISVIFMAKLQIELFVVVVFLQISLIIVQKKFSGCIFEIIGQMRKEYGELYNIIQEYILNIMNIVISKSKRKFITDYISLSRRIINKNIKTDVLLRTNISIARILNVFITIIIFGYGGYKIIKSEFTLGSLVAFQAYTKMLTGPSMNIINANNHIQKSKVSIDRVYDILDQQPNIRQDNSLLKYHCDCIDKIKFKDVYFSYEHTNSDKDKYILNNLNIEFKRGKIVALVGSSGCGKSTIVNLIYRLWDVNKGLIYFGENEIKSMNLMSLRKHISIITQDIITFDGSIKDNIVMRKKITDEKLNSVCDSVGISEFIGSLEDGINTQIGERGIKLSGGQKQKISIARAILNDSDIIIFDEATSALDNISQKNILKNLKPYLENKIVIMIAHRLSTIKNVDHIYVLKNGEVVEQGRHPELMNINGLYRKLYNDD